MRSSASAFFSFAGPFSVCVHLSMLSWLVFSQPNAQRARARSVRDARTWRAAYRGDTFRAMSRAHLPCAVCAASLRARALASPRSDPTTGRAVFTGATTPDATSIELNPAALGLGNVRDEFYRRARSRSTRSRARSRSRRRDRRATIDATSSRPGGELACIWHTSTIGVDARRPVPTPRRAERVPGRRRRCAYHTLGGGQRTYGGTRRREHPLTDELYFGVAPRAREHVPAAALRARHRARRRPRSDARHRQRLRRRAVRDREPARDRALRRRRQHVAVLGASNVVRRTSGSSYASRATSGSASRITRRPASRCRTRSTGTMRVQQAPRDGGGVVNGGRPSTAATGERRCRAARAAAARARSARRRALGGPVAPPGATTCAATARRSRRGHPRVDAARTRGFHDTFALWAGVEQSRRADQLGCASAARIGFETASVPTSATIAADDRAGVADARRRRAGAARARAQRARRPTACSTSRPCTSATSAFDPRDALDCIDSGFDYSTAACAAVRHGYAIPTAAGDYYAHRARAPARASL